MVEWFPGSCMAIEWFFAGCNRFSTDPIPGSKSLSRIQAIVGSALARDLSSVLSAIASATAEGLVKEDSVAEPRLAPTARNAAPPPTIGRCIRPKIRGRMKLAIELFLCIKTTD